VGERWAEAGAMSGTNVAWGRPLIGLFRKRPRIVFAEEYVAVWDYNTRETGTPHVFIVDDLRGCAEWFRAWHGSNKRVWIYKVRIEQVWTGTAEALVKEVRADGQE